MNIRWGGCIVVNSTSYQWSLLILRSWQTIFYHVIWLYHQVSMELYFLTRLESQPIIISWQIWWRMEISSSTTIIHRLMDWSITSSCVEQMVEFHWLKYSITINRIGRLAILQLSRLLKNRRNFLKYCHIGRMWKKNMGEWGIQCFLLDLMSRGKNRTMFRWSLTITNGK